MGLVLGGITPLRAQTPSDTLGVPNRDDHSPALAVAPSGFPALAWIATAADPATAAPGDEIVVSAHDGAAWSAPETLWGPSDLYPPEIAFAGDGGRWVVCAAFESGDSQILVRRDGGASTQSFVLGDGSWPDLEPALCAMRADSVLVAWQAWRNGNYEILAAVGDANGFSTPFSVSDCNRNDREPELVWGNGRAWIVWSSYRGEPYNLMCRTFDGALLTPTVRLTDSYRARNFHPKLAFDEVHDLLWISHTWVNQAWNGFNQHEFPGLYDRGSPHVKVFDGTTVYEPVGLNADHQVPIVPMESLGYERFLMDGGTRPMLDRWGTGVRVVVEPSGRVWCFHRQLGTITELGSSQRYWGVVGTRYDGSSWTSASQFLDLRASLGFESPAAVVAADSLWIAWSADHRSPPIQTELLNLFGVNSDIVVRRVPAGATPVGAPALVALGPATPPGACPPESHPQPQIGVGETMLTLFWGDTHRHSVDFSWDADIDPPLQETLMYSLDFLGHDFIVPSDHCERYSPAIWAWARKFAQISDVPGRYFVFPGYERSMQGYAGGHQNVLYRDFEDFTAASSALPVVNDWHAMYEAQDGLETISIPHTTAQCGVVSDWFHLSNGNPDALPAPLRLVEVYQSLRESFEYPGCPLQFGGCVADSTNGWVNVALALGMRVGLISSSDHDVRAAFAGVWAAEPSRPAIYDGLHERQTYGTTRATKVTIDFRVAGALMGSETTYGQHPAIQVSIDTNDPLVAIEINKDGDPHWFSTSCSGPDTSFTIVDPDPAIPGTSSYYYLRARPGLRAVWTSPVWVDVTGDPVGVVAPQDGAVALAIGASPNPTRAGVTFGLRGLDPRGARVRVHDVAGRLVRKLDLPPGSAARDIFWDARDESGSRVAAGTYYAVVQSGGATRSTPFVVLR